MPYILAVKINQTEQIKEIISAYAEKPGSHCVSRRQNAKSTPITAVTGPPGESIWEGDEKQRSTSGTYQFALISSYGSALNTCIV